MKRDMSCVTDAGAEARCGHGDREVTVGRGATGQRVGASGEAEVD